MYKNIETSKKIELLERQKDILSSIPINENAKESARVFKSDTIYLFTTFFGENNSFITDISKVTFDPYKLTKRAQSKKYYRAFSPENFEKCVKTATAILDSAISNIKLQQELSINQVSSKTVEKVIPKNTKKVFIVHGHDDGLKNEVARFVENQKLDAIILHEQVSRGNTIIEKIEANSDVGFAIILYTPCDVGRSSNSEQERPRARQNVIFEHGYFVAKLGRSNVVALHKGNVEIPNDLSGVVYTPYDEFGSWKRSIAHELNASGYTIDFSKV